MNNLEALRSLYNEAKQLADFAHRLYCQEEADASDVEDLDTMLNECIDALSALEDTLTEEEEAD